MFMDWFLKVFVTEQICFSLMVIDSDIILLSMQNVGAETSGTNLIGSTIKLMHAVALSYCPWLCLVHRYI